MTRQPAQKMRKTTDNYVKGVKLMSISCKVAFFKTQSASNFTWEKPLIKFNINIKAQTSRYEVVDTQNYNIVS